MHEQVVRPGVTWQVLLESNPVRVPSGAASVRLSEAILLDFSLLGAPGLVSRPVKAHLTILSRYR